MSSSKVQEKPQACNFIKKETLAQVFSCVNFAKLLRTPYILHLQNTSYRTPYRSSYRTPLLATKGCLCLHNRFL